MSISVWSSMWPMCREPVTFGGGITIEKTGPCAAGSARNKSPLDQNTAHLLSMSCGSYAFAISRAIPENAPHPQWEQTATVKLKKVIFHYTGRKQSASTRGAQYRQKSGLGITTSC